MADAVCGPSNPLQQFKHQTQADRTLQQDRLASRHNPSSYGFRSVGPSTQSLDNEFEAFQSGAPLAELPSFHPQHDMARPAPFATPQVPSWATDFQHMSISSPMPVHAQQQPFAPLSNADWAADFRQHIAQPGPRAQSYSPSPLAFQQRARFGMNSGFDTFTQPAIVERPQSKGKAVMREEFDDAAFARAFDMIAQDNVEHDVMQSVEQEPVMQPEIFDTAETMEETIEKALKDSIFDPETVLGHVHIDDPASYAASDMDYNGAGLSENVMQQQQQKPEEQQEQRGVDINADDDALAATAGELLERVIDNQSDKFQNSQFLGLMRKLRDREVKVDGDKMVETVDAYTSFDPFSRDMPLSEQDADLYRGGINPTPDGQDVVDLLANHMMAGNDIDAPAYFRLSERQQLSLAGGCFFVNRKDMGKHTHIL